VGDCGQAGLVGHGCVVVLVVGGVGVVVGHLQTGQHSVGNLSQGGGGGVLSSAFSQQSSQSPPQLYTLLSSDKSFQPHPVSNKNSRIFLI
jgi:hypothetical protein